MECFLFTVSFDKNDSCERAGAIPEINTVTAHCSIEEAVEAILVLVHKQGKI
ncbi:hypothetical protein [Brevibacillus laterosporus]|uniref:hypothetical protein n=1 Tax=Brevibacillus laterosporus TaxID=1465 RepID=UPI0018F81D22|nr:hypothetical protein [Brevibacillus laterosporus]